MLLGVHCSVAGGLEKAFEEAARLGTDTMQIFTRNQRQWKAKPVSPEEKQTFKKAASVSKVKTSFSHCSYLLNLASANEEIRNKSIIALTDEVIRCASLGLDFCVLHPGAAGEQDPDTAISKIADALKSVISETKDTKVKILLENTAGQGSSIGGKFENLRKISDLVKNKRIGYCFDTCHAFVAGYDIRTEKGFIETMDQFEKILGLENLRAFHLNDSKGELNSHLDRHEHIGKGKLGLVPFKIIMNKFTHIPKVLETPKEDDWDEKNLQVLRSLQK